MLATQQPYIQFFDNDGSPLDGGRLYYGVTNQNPETSPVAVYWDAAGTQPAAQPIRTKNGYPVRNGTPALVFIGSDYSLSVKDDRGRLLYSAPNSAEYSNDQTLFDLITNYIVSVAAAAGASLVGFMQLGSSFLRTVRDKLYENASGQDFGADATGAAPAGVQINAGLTARTCIDLGTGTYNINDGPLLIPAGKSLIGQGATLTVSNDKVAVRLLGQSSRLKGVKIAYSGTVTVNSVGVQIGDGASNARQSIVENVTVTGAWFNFMPIQGNLAKILWCSSVSAKKDGLHFDNSTVDCNMLTVLSFDDNAAGQDGIHLAGGTGVSEPTNPRSNVFIGCSVQGATQHSFYSNTPKNTLKGFYSEGAGGKDVYLDTYAYSHDIELVEGGTFTNVPGAAGGSRITAPNPDASTRRIEVLKYLFGGGTGVGFALADNDGTAGIINFEKRGARNLTIACSGSSAAAQTSLVNDVGGQVHQLGVGGNVFPLVDNMYTIGTASLRQSIIFAATGAINTSDEREKQEARALADAERATAAALKTMVKAYRWKDAFARKGDAARWHFGWIAQEVIATFESHGLDAFSYGCCCYDQWDETPEELDPEGKLITAYRPAGDRFGVRMDEILAFIIGAT